MLILVQLNARARFVAESFLTPVSRTMPLVRPLLTIAVRLSSVPTSQPLTLHHDNASAQSIQTKNHEYASSSSHDVLNSTIARALSPTTIFETRSRKLGVILNVLLGIEDAPPDIIPRWGSRSFMAVFMNLHLLIMIPLSPKREVNHSFCQVFPSS